MAFWTHQTFKKSGRTGYDDEKLFNQLDDESDL